MNNGAPALNRLIKLLKLEKKDLYQVVYYSIFAGFVSLSLPLGIQAIINLIQGGVVSTSWIVLVVIVISGVIILGYFQILQLRITENIQQKLFVRASFDFAYRFPKFKYSSYYKDHLPELSNRFFDILTIQKGLTKLILDYSAAVLQIFFGLILLSLYHPFFIAFSVLLFFLLYFIIIFSFSEGLSTSMKESSYKYKVAGWLQQIAQNYITFKNDSSLAYAININDKYSDKYLHFREKHFKVILRQYKQMVAFKVLITASLLLIGGFLVLNQQMNIGQFVAAEIIIILIISSVEKLIVGLEVMYDVLTSFEKIGLVTDLELDIDDTDNLFEPEDGTLKINLQKINYRYPDATNFVLSDINLTINKKDTIYIEGINGSGKSTLMRIIAGLLEPTRGLFYVNEDNIRKINLESYRSMVGAVIPGQSLFEGTIYENMTLNDPNISKELLNQVSEALFIRDFVKKHPEGYYAPVYPDGKYISSSLAQKIILARVILKKPKILILEEPLDYLDFEQENSVIDYLTDPKHDWILLVTSRNNYWKTKTNRVITLDKGVLI